MNEVFLKDVKLGGFFRFRPSLTALSWIRGSHERITDKYVCVMKDATEHILLRNGLLVVFVED